MPLHITYTTGYAGTGKSTKLIELAKTLPVDTSVIIAPTHKALARLRPSMPEDMELKTIHSLLGWIPYINDRATTIQGIDTTIKLARPLAEYTDIVIDEAGMMSEEMLYEITSRIEDMIGRDDDSPTICIHCFLDPYQLLPVRGTQIQVDPDTTTELTEQHRAESLDVVALYTKFVKYLEGTNKRDLSTPYSENVRPLDITQFKVGDRLLAYTNKAVGNWNKTIAQHLGITSYVGQEVQLGNRLDTTVVKEFIKPDVDYLVKAYLGGWLVLQNSQINNLFLVESLSALITNKHIQFITDDYGFIYPVIVGIHNANQAIKTTKEKALINRRLFVDVYALNRAFIMDYAFASTVHKSQGSEFDVVFIDKEDIKKSIKHKYYGTYARLMYVAISRAKKIIYI